MVAGGFRDAGLTAGQQGVDSVTLDALGIRAVQRKASEELGCHAAAPAGVEMRAGGARTPALRRPQLGEQFRGAPDPLEAAGLADVAGKEGVVDGERAGVDVPDRIDQADHPAGTAQVQPGQRLAVGGQVEEGVTGEHLLAMGYEPVVEPTLLAGGGMQVVPDVGAAAGRTQPGQPQLGAVPVGDGLELVELADVVPGDDDGQLETREAGVGQVLHGAHGGGVGTLTAYRVVDLGAGAVQRDLHVDVVAGSEPGGDLRGDTHPVGGELHADVVGGRIVDDLPEVRTDGRFPAADVDVEDLHALELVDDRLALRGRQLARVAPPRAGQAVHAGQVAGVGEFPGQADRGGQAVLEVVDQAGRRRGDVHGELLSTSMADAASVARARWYRGRSASVRPTAVAASRAQVCSGSAWTRRSSIGSLRKDSLRVPKW